MFKLPKFGRFLLTVMACYLLLIVLAQATGFRQGFANSFAGWVSAKYKDYLPHTEVSARPITEKSQHDLLLTLLNTKTVEAKMAAARKAGLETIEVDTLTAKISLWDSFLLQFIVLFSLVVASPVSWKRKGLSFLMGGALLVLFFWHRFNCSLKSYTLDTPYIEPLALSSFSKKYMIAMEGLYSIEFTFIFTFIIWALVALRKEDVKQFFSNHAQ